jgi:hypothetical protein
MVLENDILGFLIRYIGFEYIPEQATCEDKYYMRVLLAVFFSKIISSKQINQIDPIAFLESRKGCHYNNVMISVCDFL